MSIEAWAAFAAAATVVLVVPGPTIILVVGQAMCHGKKSVLPLVAGVTAGDFAAMTLSLLGMGAVLAASAALFSALKFFGALYLMYLGFKLFRTPAAENRIGPAEARKSGLSLFRQAFVVTALNPKSIVFFVAFLPQFVDTAQSVLPQLLVLGATFLTLGTINAAIYGFLAGHFRERIAKKGPGVWVNRCGGTVLIGAGVFTAAFAESS